MADWKIVRSPGWIGGLDGRTHPSLLKEEQVASIENLRHRGLQLSLVSGVDRMALGDFPNDDPGEVFRAIHEVYLTDGTEKIVMVSNRAVYLWNASTEQWDYSVSLPADNVTSARVSVLTWAPDDTVFICDGVNPIQVFDPVAETIADLAGLDGVGTNPLVTSAWDMVLWQDRVFLAAPNKAGSRKPQQIMWCDAGDPTFWDETDLSKSAGFVELLDRSEQILTIRTLRNDLIVYRQESIVNGRWVGSSTTSVEWYPMVSDESVVGPNAVAEEADYHLFVGSDSIYRYEGGGNIRAVGDPIYNLVYGLDGALTPDGRPDVRAKAIHTLQEVWFSFPVLDGTLILTYHVNVQVWSTRKLLNYGVEDFTEVSFPKDDTWGRGYTILDTPPGTPAPGDAYLVGQTPTGAWVGQTGTIATWNGATWVFSVYPETDTWITGPSIPWASFVGSEDFPPIVFLASHTVDGPQSLIQDHINALDDGVAIPWHIESKHYTMDGSFFRTEYLDFEHQGDAVTVEYRKTLDDPAWLTAGVVAASPEKRRARVYFDITTQELQIKLSGAGSGLRLGQYALRLKEESIY